MEAFAWPAVIRGWAAATYFRLRAEDRVQKMNIVCLFKVEMPTCYLMTTKSFWKGLKSWGFVLSSALFGTRDWTQASSMLNVFRTTEPQPRTSVFLTSPRYVPRTYWSLRSKYEVNWKLWLSAWCFKKYCIGLENLFLDHDLFKHCKEYKFQEHSMKIKFHGEHIGKQKLKGHFHCLLFLAVERYIPETGVGGF